MSERRTRPPVAASVVVLVLGLAGVAAFFSVGANGPADPLLDPAPLRPLSGFGQIAFSVSPAPGAGLPSSGRFCALLAETPAQLSQGLMGRRDLAGHDAMVFRFPNDTTAAFFMRDVPVPLDIAWFDSAGRFVSSTEMAPCPDREGCPLYSPAGGYRFAVETGRAGLQRLGVNADSVLTLEGGCARR